MLVFMVFRRFLLRGQQKVFTEVLLLAIPLLGVGLLYRGIISHTIPLPSLSPGSIAKLKEL